MEWYLNKLNLRRFLDFAYTIILSKTRPAISWDQALLSFSWVNRFPAAKANRKVSHFIVQYLCTWITCTCESINVCDITRTLNSTLRPCGQMPCILAGTTPASQEWRQIMEKPRYTVYEVPLTKNSLRAPLVARNKKTYLSSLSPVWTLHPMLWHSKSYQAVFSFGFVY